MFGIDDKYAWENNKPGGWDDVPDKHGFIVAMVAALVTWISSALLISLVIFILERCLLLSYGCDIFEVDKATIGAICLAALVVDFCRLTPLLAYFGARKCRLHRNFIFVIFGARNYGAENKTVIFMRH